MEVVAEYKLVGTDGDCVHKDNSSTSSEVIGTVASEDLCKDASGIDVYCLG